ncbi:MAG: DMT family transporter [Solirubrobacteraceae bacterium]|nr:DMT family transporter [Solirubrobacteraceae bacterium]
MDIALAVVAALFFALGTVLQQKAGLDEPVEGSSAGLLLQMVRRPMWLAGIAADGLGFAAQFVALAVGRVAVVQPLLVLSVVFALPLGARLTSQRVTRLDIGAAIVVTLGLVAFLAIADPHGGRDDAPVGDWLVTGLVCAAVIVPLVVASRRLAGAAARAATLGACTGILFGLSAALTSVVGHRFDDGILEVFTGWPLYALLVVGYASMTFSQLSLQTGALAPAVATQMTLDPVTSLVLAVTLLQESLDSSALDLVATVVALGLVLAGVAVLARSQQEAEAQAAPSPS